MQTDVAIVGAGPAGAWAACHLARVGARVTIYDPSHPREKPCGGGVTARALALLGAALDVSRLPAVVVTEARFAGNDSRRRAAVPLAVRGRQAHPDMVVVNRAAFDRALLDAAVAAGARHEPIRVRDVDVRADGVYLDLGSTRVRSDVVIGADGANSLVRRRTGRPFTRRQLSIAAGVFAHGIASSIVDIRFSRDPSGYLWSFPRADHLAIGACAQADTTSSEALLALTHRWVAEAALAPGARHQRYAWPIPSLPAADLEAEHPAGDRWMLVGDAAGLVDPLTREGIFFALRSAELAAETLVAGRGTGRYVEALRDTIHPELTHAARLKAGFFRGAFTDLVVEALARSRRVQAVMADLVAGRQTYRTLRRRLVGTFELGLAWQLLRLERRAPETAA
ncbi:MAG TPA: NAD(P)/FAD-dependent oxidoreductase [Vicinamibacterales bacterium]